MRQRLAAGAIVVEGDRVLLVHHRRDGVFDFWVPPGGGVHDREDLPRAAERETAEETALTVEATRLAYIDELIISDTRQCKFWFLARRVSGEISVASDSARAEQIVEAAFLSRADFPGKIVYPPVLRGDFWTHLRGEFSQPVYLGVREAEIGYPPA